MSYFGNLFTALIGRDTNVYVGTEDSFNEEVLPSLLKGIPFDIKNSDQIATVYTCCKILADSLSRLPINIIQKNANNSTEVQKEDYRYPLLHFQPNPWTSSQKFFSTLEYHRNLHGNAYARIWRDGTGRATKLTILSPSKFIKAKEVRSQLYYVFQGNDKKEKTYNADNILHFVNVSKDGVVGVSPLTALRMGLSSTWQAYQTIDKMYQNELRATKALKYPHFIPNKKAQKEAVNQFQGEYAGASNAGQLVTLPDGADLIDLQITPQDAEFISTIKFNKSDIASAYRVPLHMVGLLEATKFNSVEMMSLEFLNQGLGDILRMYRQEMEMKLLSIEERMMGKSIEFNTNAMLEVDFKTRVDGYKNLIQTGIMTPNDAAALENWPIYEKGDKHWMPSNFVYAEDREPAPTKPAPSVNQQTGE